MESELFCDDYYISDPGDEVKSIFDYFNEHPSSAQIESHYLDTTDEE